MDKDNIAAKFGYIQIVECIGRLREEAHGPEDMDRRAVLEQLCRDLEVDEATLLERGFDKAYRRIVEGV